MTKKFIKAMLIRAIRTFCQTAVATIGTAFVLSDVNWWVVLSASLLAGILAILMSIATGLPEVDNDKMDDEDFDDFEDEEVDDEDDDEQ